LIKHIIEKRSHRATSDARDLLVGFLMKLFSFPCQIPSRIGRVVSVNRSAIVDSVEELRPHDLLGGISEEGRERRE
jgi:hypothetical protein